MNCLNCGKELTKGQTKFCSNQCSSDFEHKKYIDAWKNGENNGTKGSNQLSNHVRTYLLEKANYKCERCGWGEINPYTNKIPLEIHHIDGNHEHNTEDNLQVLCPNCHSLTENFKSRGNGRANRKKDYLTNTCIDCGVAIANTSTRCSACEQKHRKEEYRKNIPISREELKARIRKDSFCSIADDFGMSDTGIKKWMTAYGLPNTKKQIKEYTDEEWELI